MARKVFAWRDGKLVEVEHNFKARPRIQLMTDSMPNLWHPGDGKHYDSKSAFRRATKALGLQEIGDAPMTTPKAPEKSTLKSEIVETARQVGFIE